MHSIVDINLEDLVDYKCGTFVAGAIPMYNGCKWVFINAKVLCKCAWGAGQGSGGVSNAVIEALENGNKELQKKTKTLEDALDKLVAKVNSMETVKEKWIEVSFNNQTEVTVNDPFVTNRTVVDFTYLGGDSDFNTVTSVDNGSVTVSVDSPISGVFLLQLSKES